MRMRNMMTFLSVKVVKWQPPRRLISKPSMKVRTNMLIEAARIKNRILRANTDYKLKVSF